jgi:WD40 repeat protein
MKVLTEAEALSPYKGLAPFDDSDLDALFFFGRERESEVIAANLMASRITVLYGPSGVGKSSVLRAGVAHRLRQEQEAAVIVFSTWTGDPLSGLIEAAGGSGDSLADALADAANRAGGDLYVILDQFEECFLYHPRGEPFASQLAQLFRRGGLRVNVLIGIREDSLARLDSLKAAIPNLLANRLRLERLDRAAAAAAIVGPVGAYNALVSLDERVEIERRLADAVLDEVTAGRVELGVAGRGVAHGAADEDRIEAPYLQLVLDRLWAVERARGSRMLRLATLRELGGAAHIVEDHLERAMAELSPAEKETAAAMYNFLVTPSGTKIAHGVSDLAGYAAVDETQAAEVLRRLTNERIVRASSVNGPTSTRYEIFHDVLAEAVVAWRTRHDAERALREVERRRRRARLVASGALLALAFVATIAVFALIERGHARTEERHAEAGQLAAQANFQLGVDPRQSLDLGLQAARLDDSPAVEGAIRDGLLASSVRRVLSMPSAVVAVGPHGRFVLGDARGRIYVGIHRRARLPSPVTSIATTGNEVAAGTQDGTIELLGPVRSSLTQKGAVTAVALGDSELAAGAPDGSVRLWRLPDGLVRLFHVRGKVTSLAFSPDRKLLLVTSHDRRARVLDAQTGALLLTLAQKGFVNAAAFSPNGRLIVTASQDHNARIWDARTGRLLHTLYGAKGGLTAVAFSPDGKLVATASSDGVGRAYFAGSGRRAFFLIGHVNAVNDIAFSPDGKTVATASSDTTVRVWTSTIGQALGVLHGHSQIVTRVFYAAPDRLVTIGADSTVRLWDAGTAPDLKVVTRQHAPFVSAVLRRNEIDVLDARGVVHTLDAPARRVTSAHRSEAVQPATSKLARHGDLLARATGDSISIHRNGKLLHRLKDLSTKPILDAANVLALKFSPDGKLIAEVGRDHYLRVWEVSTGHKLYAVVAHQGPVPDLAFSPDSRWIATAGTISVKVWDARQPSQLLLLLGPTKPVQTVLFTADGRTLVAAGKDGTIRRYDCVVCGTLPDLVRAGEARLAQTTP